MGETSIVKSMHAYVFVCGEEFDRVVLPEKNTYAKPGNRPYEYKLLRDATTVILVLRSGDFEFKNNVQDKYNASINSETDDKRFTVDDIRNSTMKSARFEQLTRNYLDEVHRVLNGVLDICEEINLSVTLFTHWGGGNDAYVDDVERLVAAVLSTRQVIRKSILYRGKGRGESFAMSSKRRQAYDLFVNSRPLTKAVCEEIYHVLVDFPVRDAMFQMISDWQRKQYAHGCGTEKDLETYTCSCKINNHTGERLRKYLKRCKSGMAVWCERGQLGWVQTVLDSLLDELEKTSVESVELCDRSIALLTLLCERFDLTCKCCD